MHTSRSPFCIVQLSPLSRVFVLYVLFTLGLPLHQLAQNPVHDPDNGGSPAPPQVLWRGFMQNWLYSHRIQQVGNYATPVQPGQPNSRTVLVNTAASGDKPDKVEFQSFFSLLFTEGVHYMEGEDSLVFEGQEEELMHRDRMLSIPAPADWPWEDQYTVVLNGFDLIAREEGERLMHLSFSVGDAILVGDSLQFMIEGGLQTDCSVLGCRFLNKSTAWTLKIRYLILAGQPQYHSTEVTLSRDYYWDKKQALNREMPEQLIESQAEERYSVGVPALKKVSYTFEQPQWLLSLSCAVHYVDYDPETGTLKLIPDFFFLQWADDMEKSMGTGGKGKGVVLTRTQVALLEFRNGCLRHDSVRGTYQVDGQEVDEADEGEATDSEAKYRSVYSFLNRCP